MDKNGATSTLMLWLFVASFYEATDGVALDATCTTDADCTTTVENSECAGGTETKACACVEGYTQQDAVCKANLGVACATNAECGNGVCDSTRKPSICAIGVTDACVETNADKCVLNAECSDDTCSCKSGYTASDKLCLADLGVACATNAECGSGVCDSTKSTSICALGVADACAETNADKCVMNAECTDDTCSCKSGYTANGKLCVGAPGSACEASTDCAENHVCDTNANPVTCALASGAHCDADDSKCMIYSECTEERCTCSNGDADGTTKLCPAPNSGFRETSSMIVVAACLCLSIL